MKNSGLSVRKWPHTMGSILLGTQKDTVAKEGSSVLVQVQVGSSDKHFTKLVIGTTPNNFRLWNIGAPLALF